MDTIIERYNKIKSNIIKMDPKKQVNIVAVSKTFSIEHIKPLIDYGHLHFGENKVQEAAAKWKVLKNEKKNLKLHMIGKLQSNKAKNALEIFDYIHSLDSQKLADILSRLESNTNRFIKYFIQVNIGNELQKSGIPVRELEDFYNYCVNERKLNIIGLMIIPPVDQKVISYFQSVDTLNKSLNLEELSMGMSADYMDAIKYNSTFIRVGSYIFGKRI
tara:strand:+ start:5748 stop:6398 length:651 start_codon:yes stop_codon:yes gene_type:complete